MKQRDPQPDEDVCADDEIAGIAVDEGSAAPTMAGGVALDRDLPWRNWGTTTPWLYDRAQHAWVLLGGAAVESFEAFEACYRRCRRDLEVEAESNGRHARDAADVLGDPRFRELADIDPARWAIERGRYRRATREWAAFIQALARVRVLSVSGFADLAAGIPRDDAEAELRARRPDLWPPLPDDEVAAILRLDGSNVADVEAFVRHVLGSEGRWRGTSAALEKIMDTLSLSPAPEARRLFTLVRDALAQGPGDVALWRVVWSVEPLLRIPYPWSATEVRSPENLVAACDARPAMLVPSAASGVLSGWLAAVGRADLAAGLSVPPAQREIALWRLLWSLGERRLRIGDLAIRTAKGVHNHALRGRPELDAAIDSGILVAWMETTGDAELSRLAKVVAASPRRLAVRILVYGTGDSEFRLPDEYLSFAATKPKSAIDLLRYGALDAWARARGLGTVPTAAPGWSPERVINEAAWALGSRRLLVGSVVASSTDELVVALRKREAGVLPAVERSIAEGAWARWVGIVGGRERHPNATARDVLHDAGFSAFYDPQCGWIEDAAALGRWGAGNRPAFEALVRHEGLVEWCERRGWCVGLARGDVDGLLRALRPRRSESQRVGGESIVDAAPRAPAAGPVVSFEPREVDFGARNSGYSSSAQVWVKLAVPTTVRLATVASHGPGSIVGFGDSIASAQPSAWLSTARPSTTAWLRVSTPSSPGPMSGVAELEADGVRLEIPWRAFVLSSRAPATADNRAAASNARPVRYDQRIAVALLGFLVTLAVGVPLLIALVSSTEAPPAVAATAPPVPIAPLPTDPPPTAVFGPPEPPPSFDCTKSASEVERRICGNVDLAAADTRMADAWAGALSATGAESRDELLDGQREWLAGRGMLDDDALLQAYHERTRLLEAMPTNDAGASQSAEPTNSWDAEEWRRSYEVFDDALTRETSAKLLFGRGYASLMLGDRTSALVDICAAEAAHPDADTRAWIENVLAEQNASCPSRDQETTRTVRF